MTCCKCNKTGRCRNCSCVKAGIHCQSCLPSRLGSCSNITSTETRQTATTSDIPSAEVSPSSSPLPSQSSSPPDNGSVQLIRDQELPSIPLSHPQVSRPSPIAAVQSPVTTYSAVVAGERPTSLSTAFCFPCPSASTSLNPVICASQQPIATPTFDLPEFSPSAVPKFVWGNCADSVSFCNLLKDAYDEVVHWRKNCFKIPWEMSANLSSLNYLGYIMPLLTALL